MFLVNDLSVHGQFPTVASFGEAVAKVMQIRAKVQQHGYELYCHRKLLTSKVTAELGLRQAVSGMSVSRRRAFLLWLTRQGPFWEESRLHNGNDWLEVGGEVVTDSAVGEAAVCVERGVRRDLVSFAPSSRLCSPVVVRWVREDGSAIQLSVPNHHSGPTVERALTAHPKPICSWADLSSRVRIQYSELFFAENAFESLDGQPFAPGAAERIRVLLGVLDRLRGCYAADGSRTPEGNRLYQDHFTGDKAWFSDSSSSEKSDFRRDLTFRHPEAPLKQLFCPWHGKEKSKQYRVHFSSPIAKDVPLYIVYVGPKITKR